MENNKTNGKNQLRQVARPKEVGKPAEPTELSTAKKVAVIGLLGGIATWLLQGNGEQEKQQEEDNSGPLTVPNETEAVKPAKHNPTYQEVIDTLYHKVTLKDVRYYKVISPHRVKIGGVWRNDDSHFSEEVVVDIEDGNRYIKMVNLGQQVYLTDFSAEGIKAAIKTRVHPHSDMCPSCQLLAEALYLDLNPETMTVGNHTAVNMKVGQKLVDNSKVSSVASIITGKPGELPVQVVTSYDYDNAGDLITTTIYQQHLGQETRQSAGQFLINKATKTIRYRQCRSESWRPWSRPVVITEATLRQDLYKAYQDIALNVSNLDDIGRLVDQVWPKVNQQIKDAIWLPQPVAVAATPVEIRPMPTHFEVTNKNTARVQSDGSLMLEFRVDPKDPATDFAVTFRQLEDGTVVSVDNMDTLRTWLERVERVQPMGWWWHAYRYDYHKMMLEQARQYFAPPGMAFKGILAQYDNLTDVMFTGPTSMTLRAKKLPSGEVRFYDEHKSISTADQLVEHVNKSYHSAAKVSISAHRHWYWQQLLANLPDAPKLKERL